MKSFSIYVLTFLIFISIYSCNSKHKNQTINSKIVTDTESKIRENAGNPIDYDNTKVLKTVYVVDNDGVEMKQEDNLSSATLGKYNYGEKLEVIEVKNGWLGIRDRISRQYKKNGKTIITEGWEKLYVQTQKTGNLNSLKLIPEDLNIVVSITKNNKTEDFENGIPLNDKLKFELINKTDFESKKKTTVTFLISDTTNINKKNGIIELQCDNIVKRYIDKPDAEEQRQEFSYIGNIPFLNKYVISGSYYESSDFKLVDKITGKEVILGDYPLISADKNYIISINANVYDTTADIELYSIDNTNIKLIFSASFKNWMPASEKENCFWSSDGYLYVPVLHSKAYWNHNGDLNTNFQYMRIKVL
jgi:hypothetical protein